MLNVFRTSRRVFRLILRVNVFLDALTTASLCKLTQFDSSSFWMLVNPVGIKFVPNLISPAEEFLENIFAIICPANPARIDDARNNSIRTIFQRFKGLLSGAPVKLPQFVWPSSEAMFCGNKRK
jgi:hypothetical protein